MFKFSVLFAVFIQLAMSIVLPLRNGEPTTLPTELYKPLESVTESSESSSQDIQTPSPQSQNYQQRNANAPFNFEGLEDFKKYIASQTFTLDSDNSVPLQPNTAFNTIRYESSNNAIPIITQRFDSSPISDPFVLSAVNNPQPSWGFPSADSSGNSGFYKMSSSHSYYNSDTMSEPVVRHYEFDSRNGGGFK